jgi:hypothetical protein
MAIKTICTANSFMVAWRGEQGLGIIAAASLE